MTGGEVNKKMRKVRRMLEKGGGKEEEEEEGATREANENENNKLV